MNEPNDLSRALASCAVLAANRYPRRLSSALPHSRVMISFSFELAQQEQPAKMRASYLPVHEPGLADTPALFAIAVCEIRPNQQSDECSCNIEKDIAN